MVKLAKEADGIRLLDFASVELSPRQSKEEKLMQLSELAQEKGITSQAVNIGVAGETVIVRYIDLPKMKNEELSLALKYEAQQYIPFKIEEVVFDYHILEPSSSLKDRMKVLLVAAKRDAIIEFIGFIRQSGLKANLIDVNSFSLINCFQQNGPEVKEDDVFALTNVKLDLVNINILQGKMPFFTREISLIEDIQAFPEGKSKEGLLFEALKPHLANLIREVHLSIDYFESEFEKQVRVIYLSGEGSRISELVSLFNSQLEREIYLWNPLQNLIVDSAQIDTETLKGSSSMLAIACGLALRGVH